MATEKNRRSTAAQYFMDDEEDERNPKTTSQRVVDWLNEASLTAASNKVELLSKVQEAIVHKESALLDNFLDEMLAFQSDRNSDVRKFIVGFIEEASKKDSDLLPRVLPSLQMLLADSSAQVQKRVIQAFNIVYRNVLAWVAKATTVSDDMNLVWSIQSNIKKMIIDMVDSENDGIRTHSVKFLETLVLLQTYPEADSLRRENDFSLEDIPMGLKIARRRKLEEEALTIFDLMVKFHGSPHISSVNLMACMGSLTLIAKMRPQFMGKVVAALETLHTNLPPTLTKSQVSSVRKHLKLQLLTLLKHPAAMDFLQNITTLLTDLGATYHEVMKSYPKSDEIRKRIKRSATGALETVAAKKTKVADTSSSTPPPVPLPAVVTETAIDITEQYIMERMCPELATDLVIMAMDNVPDTMPPLFAAIYTPIAAAGTQGQIKHVARLLATQLNAVGLGPGSEYAKKSGPSVTAFRDDDEEEEEEDKQKIHTLVQGVVGRPTPLAPPPPTLNLSNIKHPKRRALKLSEITRPMDERKRQRMAVDAVRRILQTEKSAIMGGVFPLYTKMIATLGTTSNDDVKQTILQYITEDLRKRLHLALAWLYEEYSYMQGFNRLPPALEHKGYNAEKNYSSLLRNLIQSIIYRPDIKERETLLYRVYLEAPLITDNAIETLKELCTKETVCLAILQELVVRRPPRFLIYINALLSHTSHENSEVREMAINCVVSLYNRNDLQSIIEEYAVFYLTFLRLPKPPEVLFGPDKGRPERADSWSDEAIRACLYLYLTLLPVKQELIHELAATYVQTGADVKRTILRLVEQPVRQMGMHSPQLLKLVEECPKGSETLVTRIIHILTDKSPPSVELVARVRELYQSRVSDVRFLIPVLNGLPKQEIIAALPKLIKLNPIVVKEVFNRLVGSHSEHSSPISPTDLLVALHVIDPIKCELKTVIKATSLCFAEKQAYTQEILAIVIQQLMEITPLPTLLMRTVIQALSLYPRLIGFVMNVLQRLILKQVWKQRKVWEGFIKCCQRTKPQSFQVLLQLPPAQLADVLESSPDLRQPLREHVLSFTDTQRAYIPQPVMDILMGGMPAQFEQFNIKQEPSSPPDLTIDIKEEPPEEVEPAPPGMD
ncbi:symplekin-like [Macrosteles quadrilineatus]|uniref:symplekin-like n=1 Tax=Macrosteles quadrilineatus TaxID=74068 RepID=UPI0023E298DB|nr:symplekin-like [Macrosteles quadrilineatus]